MTHWLAFCILVMTLLIASSAWVIFRVLLPLRRIIRQATALERGDFNALEQPCGGIPEINYLRRSMASMAGHVRRAQEQARGYSDALTAGQEAERERIARELHDDTVQSMIGIAQGIDLALHWLERDPARGAATLKAARGQVTESVDNLRRLIGDLRPPALDELGLIPALKMLANSAAPIPIHIETEGTERRLNPDVELALFRIAQETVRNAQRHSRATHIDLHVTYLPDSIRLEIADNGVGFAIPAQIDTLAESGHYGLLGIHERATQLKGKLAISSTPGQGTRIQIDVPFEAQEQPGDTVRDPVCSALIHPQRAYGSVEYGGKRYYFCCPVCLGAFQQHPEVYLSNS